MTQTDSDRQQRYIRQALYQATIVYNAAPLMSQLTLLQELGRWMMQIKDDHITRRVKESTPDSDGSISEVSSVTDAQSMTIKSWLRILASAFRAKCEGQPGTGTTVMINLYASCLWQSMTFVLPSGSELCRTGLGVGFVPQPGDSGGLIVN